MSLKLYEINKMYYECLDQTINEDGEIVDVDLYELLDDIQEELEKKALNVGAMFKSLSAEADAIKQEETKLSKRRKVLENQADRLKEYLFMNVPDGIKLEDARCKLSWRKSEMIEIENPEILPKELQKVVINADKAKVKELLKSGKQLEGCRIIQKNNIQIR
jgi:uncharacterized protein (UPF0179 family)